MFLKYNNYEIAKRILDLTVSVLALFLLLPVILIIITVVFALLLQSPIFKQKRFITLNQKHITIYKIRTIRSSKIFHNLEAQSKSVFNKSEYETFIPKFCGWLRKTGFDEIPQLINVIKGEMSLVGPRPLIKDDLRLFQSQAPALNAKRNKINAKPGITCCWQVWGNRKHGIENLIVWDEYYDSNKSLFLDLKIMLATSKIMLTASHSDSVLGNFNNVQTKSMKRRTKDLQLIPNPR